MSLLLLVLACAVFAQTTSEFMLAGLVGEIAAEFGVPLVVAGSLTSAFAVGMVVGAPLMALLARRLAPRAALAGFLALFVVVHVAGFWVVAALATAALALLPLVVVPPGSGSARPSVRAEFAVLRRPVVATTLLVAVLVNAGTFSAYTYLGVVLVGGGASAAVVPVSLAVFGVGACFGVALAARVADTYDRRLVLGGGSALLAAWSAMALASDTTVVVVALGTVTGLLAFAVGSGVIARSMALVPDAPTLGGSFTTAALNIGATAGPLAGGAAVAASPSGAIWVAVAAVALAAIPAGQALRLEQARTSARGPAAGDLSQS